MPGLLKVLSSPAGAARTLQRRPRWLGAFLFLAALWVLFGFLEHPSALRATLERLPVSAAGPGQAAVVRALDEGLLLRLAFLPLRLLLGWGTFAALLWGAGRSFLPAGSAGFLQTLALEVHAEAAMTISRGIECAATLGGMPAARIHPFSLEWIFGGTGDPLVQFLLRSTNLCTLWYGALLAGGVTVLFRCRFRTAILLVAGVWLVSLGFSLGAIALLRDIFYFRLTP
jgi:hypothetical protein